MFTNEDDERVADMTNVLEFKKKKKLPIPREVIVIKRIDGEDIELVNVDALIPEQRQVYFDGQYE